MDKLTDHIINLPDDDKTTEERAKENGWISPEPTVYVLKNYYTEFPTNEHIISKKELETPWYRRFENKRRKKF